MSENVTLGEVYRLCQRIETAVQSQNGRVRKLEDGQLRLKTIWAVISVSALMFGDSVKRKLGF